MNKFVKTISSDKLGYEFLRSLNGLLGLTNRQTEILSFFLSLYMDKSRRGKEKNDSIDCARNRKIVIDHAKVRKENLSRYIKSFKKKKLFIKDATTGKNVINEALIPILIANKTVQITMILKIKDDE